MIRLTTEYLPMISKLLSLLKRVQGQRHVAAPRRLGSVVPDLCADPFVDVLRGWRCGDGHGDVDEQGYPRLHRDKRTHPVRRWLEARARPRGSVAVGVACRCGSLVSEDARAVPIVHGNPAEHLPSVIGVSLCLLDPTLLTFPRLQKFKLLPSFFFVLKSTYVIKRQHCPSVDAVDI